MKAAVYRWVGPLLKWRQLWHCFIWWPFWCGHILTTNECWESVTFS